MLAKYLVISLILLTSLVYAEDSSVIIPSPKWPELALSKEYIVDNMSDGNLSGIAVCNGALWVVSDRSDYQIYQLPLPTKINSSILTAQIKPFTPPIVTNNTIPLFSEITNVAIGVLRGGFYDFEGISCDLQGNIYLVSEAYLAVLKIPTQGEVKWLPIPNELWQQAKKRGLLQNTNDMLEGIAIDPQGKRLWLAAERKMRGILTINYNDKDNIWQCPNNQCVLLAEGGRERFPQQFRRPRIDVRDFSDLAFYKEKLFTLERGAFRICRRNLKAEVEQCWSIAKEALQPNRQYYSYGMPEALWIDEQGAWIGLDNDIANKRVDGETRPIIWRFATPANGWLATPGLLK